jgi:hypothetical protein
MFRLMACSVNTLNNLVLDAQGNDAAYSRGDILNQLREPFLKVRAAFNSLAKLACSSKDWKPSLAISVRMRARALYFLAA